MTNHRPLRRSSTDRQLAGILAGIARYFGLEVRAVRVGYFFLTLLSAAFPGILLYIVLYFIIPEEGWEEDV